MLSNAIIPIPTFYTFYRSVFRICVSYCMVGAYVREGYPRALASGLSPVHMHKPYNNCLIVPACALWDI